MRNLNPIWMHGVSLEPNYFVKRPPNMDELIQWAMKAPVYENESGEWFWEDKRGDQLREVHKGLYGDFDGSTNSITFDDLTGVTITSYEGTGTPSVNGNNIDVTVGSLNLMELSNGSIYDFEDGVGNKLQDKSINGLHGTINGDLTDFWQESIEVESYKNENGYNIDTDGTQTGTIGTYIPRLETPENLSKSIKSQTDIYGNTLDFYGRARYDIQAVGNSIIEFNSGNYIEFVDLTGITITEFTGSATPTINGNNIEFTAGTGYYLELSNGSKYVFGEGANDKIYDKVNGLHGIIKGDLTDIWSTSDTQRPNNLLDGFSYPPSDIAVQDLFTDPIDFETSTIPDTVNSNDAELVASNCLLFTGGIGKLNTPTLSFGETIVEVIGTADADIGVNEISFTNGSLFSIEINNGDKFVASSGAGTTIYNVATAFIPDESQTFGEAEVIPDNI